MFLSTVITRRGGVWVLFFVAFSILAMSASASAGEAEDRPVFRAGGGELRLVGPYQAGKVPVVFIHGMLGSPGNWLAMIEQLSTDPTVRNHAQFLTYHYDYFQSIPESGQELRTALDEARRRFDPEGRDLAFDRAVLVGHSMGGLLAKVVARTPDQRPPGAGGPLPGGHGGPVTTQVGRIIFVATPHRGTKADQGPVRSVGSWFARTVSPSVLIRRSGGSNAAGGPVTSVDQLTWDHPLLADLERAGATARIPYHSIIASVGDPSAEGANDGLVPVASARLASARSEVVVRTSHGCFQHADVIREVRRILIEHSANAEVATSQPTH